jgi:phosphatidylglycerol:prolipoprotein diacylglycerol transferase
MLYLIGYSLGRFWIEGLRTDSLMFGGIRVAQLVSAVSIVAGMVGLWWLHIRKNNFPDILNNSQQKS